MSKKKIKRRAKKRVPTSIRQELDALHKRTFALSLMVRDMYEALLKNKDLMETL